MKKYSKFKYSGIDWMGEVPSHWKGIKIKHIGRLYGGLTGKSGDDFRKDEDDPSNRPFIPFTNICNNTYINKTDLKLVSISHDDNQNVVKKHDLFIMMTSETQEDVGKTSVLREDLGEVYLNTFCKGFRITDESVNPFFLNYLLNGKTYRILLSIEGNGYTRINLRQDKVSDLFVLLPPLPEQQAIVSFLDDKTSQIDTLISNSQTKIELLKEKRTALINHAVTKGLDPKAKMKDSGVEWIGEIPEGWRIVQLNHVASKITNGFVGPTRDILVGSGVKYIQGIHLKNDYIRYTPDGDYYVTEEWSINHSRSILKEGDVLLVQSGSIGEIGYVTKEFEGSNCHALIIVQFEPTIMSGKYFMYQLKSNYAQSFLQTIKTGEILQHLNTTKVKYFKSINPPIAVQQEIVEFLDHHTSEIDREVSLEEKRIELLKEYRQSLISEVVTGKINVSDYAIQPN